MRLLLAGENNLEAIRSLGVDPIVTRQCDQSFPSSAESALCQRSAMAGLAFLNSVVKTSVSFSTPAPETPSKTLIDGYPSRQCRLDTILAGALCKANASVDPDRYDETVGVCTSGTGARPACWYRR